MSSNFTPTSVPGILAANTAACTGAFAHTEFHHCTYNYCPFLDKPTCIIWSRLKELLNGCGQAGGGWLPVQEGLNDLNWTFCCSNAHLAVKCWPLRRSNSCTFSRCPSHLKNLLKRKPRARTAGSLGDTVWYRGLAGFKCVTANQTKGRHFRSASVLDILA